LTFSNFFEVHANSNCQQLLCSCSMERIIFEHKEGEQEGQHLIPALQLPIPDIEKEEMNKLIDLC